MMQKEKERRKQVGDVGKGPVKRPKKQNVT